MSRLISRVELARHARVSKPAITKAARGPLAAACERDRIDLDHPLVHRYLTGKLEPAELAKIYASGPEPDQAAAVAPRAPRRRVVAPTEPTPKAPKKAAKPAAAPTAETPPDQTEHVEEELGPLLLSATDQGGSREDLIRLRKVFAPLIARFGTGRMFRDWLDALKGIEDIRKKRLDNEETEGRLISRELVKTHVFGAIEGSHRRLLGDLPKTAVRLVYAMANAKEPIEAAEQRLRDIITTVLRPVKATAERVVEDA